MNLTPQKQSAYIPNVSEGIFALDWPTYKADDGLNQSSAKIIAAKSMLHWETERKQEKEPSADQIMGSLVHLATLEPELFGEGKSHHTKPETYPAPATHAKVKKGLIKIGDPLKWSGNAQYCKDWLAEREEDGLPIINPDTFKRVLGMMAALLKDELAKNFLAHGSKEVCIFCNCPLTGVRRKARIDLLCRTDESIMAGDFKKMPCVEESEAQKTFAKWGYHVQADFTKTLLSDLFEKFGPEELPIRFINGCVEHLEPHEVLWYEPGPKSLRKGNAIWRKALGRFHLARTTGKLEGYPKDIKIRALEIPTWALREMGEEE